MAWNAQRGGPWGGGGGGGGSGGGGGGGGQGPWGGGGGGGGQTPDIEEMLRRGQERVKRFIPSGGGGKRIAYMVAAAVLIWAALGFYRVQPGEQGVEILFGEYLPEPTTSGLHYWFPRPIGRVITPNVEQNRVIQIGFRQMGLGRTAEPRDIPQESLMLTGDQNIIDIDFEVHWRIKLAPAFLFNIRDPEATIKLAAESAIREVVGQTPLDDALSKKRGLVETQTKDLLQKILDSYGAGVSIGVVKLQTAEPPQPVIDAFNDVQRAKQDKERQQNEAIAYRNDIVPKAKGEAQRMIEEARAYRSKLIKESEGEAKRFLSVYEAYKTGKEVTIRRLYLERMQEVLRNSEKVIIDTGLGGPGVVPYLPLPEIQKRSGGTP